MKASNRKLVTVLGLTCFWLLAGRAHAAVTCDIQFVLADDITLGAIQFETDYSATGGQLVGTAGTVDCQMDIPGTLFAANDEGGPGILHWTTASVQGIDGPATLGHCTYTGNTVPSSSDFALTELDSVALGSVSGSNRNVCGSPETGASTPTARDAYVILRKADGHAVSCANCECDADNSGSVGASDALRVVRRSVGLSGALNCPACGGAPSAGAASSNVDVNVVVDCDSPCQPTPDPNCSPGLKSSLVVADSSDDFGDSIKWKLGGGPATEQIDLGDPAASTTVYYFCLYDNSSGSPFLATQLTIPGSERWDNKDPKGLSYKDADGLSDGVTKLQIKTGAAGASKVALGAKGLSIPMPSPPQGATTMFESGSPVVAELRSSASSLCWTSSFAIPKVNTPTKFSAKTP